MRLRVLDAVDVCVLASGYRRLRGALPGTAQRHAPEAAHARGPFIQIIIIVIGIADQIIFYPTPPLHQSSFTSELRHPVSTALGVCSDVTCFVTACVIACEWRRFHAATPALLSLWQVFSHPSQAAAKGSAARHTMVTQYSVPRVASFVKLQLQRIAAALGLNVTTAATTPEPSVRPIVEPTSEPARRRAKQAPKPTKKEL